jgi:hypothetical protein
MLLETNSSSPKGREVLRLLFSQLSGGWAAFTLAKYVYEQWASGRIKSAPWFFTIVREESVEITVLAMSRLLLGHTSSISITYLLNYAEKNPGDFPGSRGNAISESVAQHRTILETISPIINNIKNQRDKTIAHLDRLHINNPAALYAYPPLDQKEVEDVFRQLLKILNVYAGYLSPSEELKLDSINLGLGEDLEYLRQLIEQDNARP